MLRELIDVFNPKPLSYLNELDSQCKLIATGDISPGNTLIKVYARINRTYEIESTEFNGLQWTIRNVGPCNLANRNTFEVKADYKDEFNNLQHSEYTDRCVTFLCKGTTYSCYNYAMGAYNCFRGSIQGGEPLRVILPRYYKLSLQAIDDEGFGGLVQRNNIYLCYDAEISSPEEGVWRSDGLPDSFGLWTLRVRSFGKGYEGQLVLQKLEQRRVLRPQIYESETWNIHGTNRLKLSHECCKKEAGALAMAILSVEPA
jgi:hypothetical protein